MSFNIIGGKEGASPKKPLFLVTITAPDGDVTCLTTAAYYGAPSISYGGNTYLARIQKNDVLAIQSTGVQGYDTVPGFTLTLADADKLLWTNHCVPHGWRGAVVTLTVILFDVVANAYSTDSLQWSFIGGNPAYDDASGSISMEAASACSFTRMKVPSIPLESRCPWDFPYTLKQRLDGQVNKTSLYYQCGYCADAAGGVGNLIAKTTLSGAITAGALACSLSSTAGLPAVPFQATLGGTEEILVTAVAGVNLTIQRGQHGTTAAAFSSGAAFAVPFTTCDLTRSSLTDPSVGCMARMGNGATVSVAPDGDLCHDTAANYTGRFGGCTWLAPAQFSGKAYTSGQKVAGYNSANTAIAGSYYNWVYGTQWVQCQVLAPAGDPNSVRSEAVVCVAAFGPANVIQLLVNGVIIPQNNSDVLMTWRYVNQGGRNGALNNDAIFNSHGDPGGSLCKIEFVVPAELAAPGSVPTVQALVTSGPLLNCYAIASIASGVVTFTGPNYSCAGNPPYTVQVLGNSNAALNGTFQLTNWTGGNPGTVTLQGTSASGTGGAVFFYSNPDLYDTGGSIVTNPTGNFQNIAGPACNLAFAYLDLMTWGNINLTQIEPVSWYNAALICAKSLNYTAANGSAQAHAQFKASFALSGGSRQSLAQVLTSLRNAGNLMVAPNSTTGLIQCFVRQTLADQQPSPVSGSNDSTARVSLSADGTAANGYFAYVFDETNIEKDSFRITTTRAESTPNLVAIGFQDEYNGYQQDSLTEIDPVSYQYSGNQEIAVPVPVLGIPNFDQGTRIANTQLSEALMGNPRNDPGGTQYFEFTVNHRVLHLVSRLGYICGLTWQPLGIGGATPQAIRILSAQPDTDGEHWRIKAMWHTDRWYTYAYVQDPTPYKANPLLSPPARPPYPWRAGVSVWGASDALFPNQQGFQVSEDASSYPVQLTLSGAMPVNVQPATKPPLVPLQASTANTGGSIKPGTYMLALSTNGAKGPVSNFVLAVVPAGTNTNTITITGVQWQSGAAPSVQPYIGTSALNMRACGASDWTGSVNDANGNPTTFTFTAFAADGLGLPDVAFNGFRVDEYLIVQQGNLHDTVSSVDGTGKVLTFGAGGWTVSQWVGSVLSLLYRPGVAIQPALNQTITASTANSLTVGATGFLAGDVACIRSKAGNISANTIGDANLVNSYQPSGMGTLAGSLVYILAGTGSGQSPKSIASNTTTVLTITGTWDVTPDATSVFVVLSPSTAYSYTTPALRSDGTVAMSVIAKTMAQATQGQSLLVVASTVDAAGAASPWQYQDFREVYIPPLSLGGASLTPVAQVTGFALNNTAPFTNGVQYQRDSAGRLLYRLSTVWTASGNSAWTAEGITTLASGDTTPTPEGQATGTSWAGSWRPVPNGTTTVAITGYSINQAAIWNLVAAPSVTATVSTSSAPQPVTPSFGPCTVVRQAASWAWSAPLTLAVDPNRSWVQIQFQIYSDAGHVTVISPWGGIGRYDNLSGTFSWQSGFNPTTGAAVYADLRTATYTAEGTVIYGTAVNADVAATSGLVPQLPLSCTVGMSIEGVTPGANAIGTQTANTQTITYAFSGALPGDPVTKDISALFSVWNPTFTSQTAPTPGQDGWIYSGVATNWGIFSTSGARSSTYTFSRSQPLGIALFLAFTVVPDNYDQQYLVMPPMPSFSAAFGASSKSAAIVSVSGVTVTLSSGAAFSAAMVGKSYILNGYPVTVSGYTSASVVTLSAAPASGALGGLTTGIPFHDVSLVTLLAVPAAGAALNAAKMTPASVGAGLTVTGGQLVNTVPLTVVDSVTLQNISNVISLKAAPVSSLTGSGTVALTGNTKFQVSGGASVLIASGYVTCTDSSGAILQVSGGGAYMQNSTGQNVLKATSSGVMIQQGGSTGPGTAVTSSGVIIANAWSGTTPIAPYVQIASGSIIITDGTNTLSFGSSGIQVSQGSNYSLVSASQVASRFTSGSFVIDMWMNSAGFGVAGPSYTFLVPMSSQPTINGIPIVTSSVALARSGANSDITSLTACTAITGFAKSGANSDISALNYAGVSFGSPIKMAFDGASGGSGVATMNNFPGSSPSGVGYWVKAYINGTTKIIIPAYLYSWT